VVSTPDLKPNSCKMTSGQLSGNVRVQYLYINQVGSGNCVVVALSILHKARNRNTSVVVLDLGGNENIPNFGRFAAKTTNCACVDDNVWMKPLNSDVGI
jgi:hypothetical protein